MSGDEPAILRSGALERFTTGRRVVSIGNENSVEGLAAKDPLATEVVLSYRKLQDIADYRQALQTWFDLIDVGNNLIVIVPHAFLYERQLALPSPWRIGQKRLYTAGSLLMEVEEALTPNSYRVRWVGDLDDGYDYELGPDREPQTESDVMVVLERIAPPHWSLERSPARNFKAPLDTADFAFEPVRTRLEMDTRPSLRRILIMKLDHLGDLIMGLPALERARQYFAEATIDLVVGSWNAEMARDLKLADRVIAFDAFPRNSSEEEPNVNATLGQFRATITDEYDLAIDLRADVDTRVLLHAVKSPLKAGIGTRARFPFLDIALPLDSTRNEAERIRDERIEPGVFSSQGSAKRSPFAVHSDKKTVEREYAIVWGPYLELDPGDYIFDFYIDLEEMRGDGLIRLDIALDHGTTVVEMVVSGPSYYRLPFRVEKPKTIFEARIFTINGQPSISFSFYGGRLIKRGPGNVLHQSEYAALLIEFVKLRTKDFGISIDVLNP